MVLRSLPGLPRSTTTIWPGSDAGNVSDRRQMSAFPQRQSLGGEADNGHP
jgi:hypothetical protein